MELFEESSLLAYPAEDVDDSRRGLPARWADLARHPIRVKLSRDGWVRILWRYKGIGPSPPWDNIVQDTLGKSVPTLVMLESHYIDADYRDEFSHFYSRTFRPLPSRCERLHFFHSEGDQQQYLGFVVLRPVIGRPICRTMLAPPSEVAPHVACLAVSRATPYGYRLSVAAFPFISQDYQIGRCSHAAIWMIALYFHLRFRSPRYYLSDLVASANRHQDYLPSTPSAGLTPRQIMAILHDLKMPPVMYRLDIELPPNETVETIACRYLNSGLPVMLLSENDVSGHAQVLIGYRRDDAGQMHFIYHDDQVGPYLQTTKLETGSASEDGSAERRWRTLVVPLPGRIYLSGEAAESAAKLIFEEVIEQNEPLSSLVGGLIDHRLRLRAYAVEVSDYKRALRTRGLPTDVMTWHINESTSRWLWVIELQDRQAAAESPHCVLGEVAIDATSDDNWPNPLFGNLPGMTIRWPSIGDEMEVADSTQDFMPYTTGCALHVTS